MFITTGFHDDGSPVTANLISFAEMPDPTVKMVDPPKIRHGVYTKSMTLFSHYLTQVSIVLIIIQSNASLFNNNKKKG